MRVLAVLSALFILAGCSARPRIMPAEALAAALAHPTVTSWHRAHSAPAVLAQIAPAAAQGLDHYKPVAMVDLGSDGLIVRFDSALGPSPRRVEVVVDKQTGQILAVKQR